MSGGFCSAAGAGHAELPNFTRLVTLGVGAIASRPDLTDFCSLSRPAPEPAPGDGRVEDDGGHGTTWGGAPGVASPPATTGLRRSSPAPLTSRRYVLAGESAALDLVLHGPESGRPRLDLTDDEVLAALAALDARWAG